MDERSSPTISTVAVSSYRCRDCNTGVVSNASPILLSVMKKKVFPSGGKNIFLFADTEPGEDLSEQVVGRVFTGDLAKSTV